MNIENTKKCNTCGEVKSIYEFYKNRSSKDGIGNKCKNCFTIYYNINYKSIEQYRQKNIDRKKKHDKIYREENIDKIQEREKIYRKSDIGRVNRTKALHKRRAMKLNQLHPNHNPTIEATLHSMKNRISKCLCIQFHLDHIWPLSQGGPHHHENLQVIPQTLNNQKLNNLNFQHDILRDWTDIPIHLLKWIRENQPEKFKVAIKKWLERESCTLDEFKQYLINKQAA